MTGRFHVRFQRESGDVAVLELVLLMPVLLALLLLMVGLGRLGVSRLDIDDVTADAARAASLARSPTGAEGAARQAATDSLGSHALTCNPLEVAVDVSAFRPGGWVTVTLVCTIPADRLGATWVPEQRTLTARSTAAIETYRGIAR